MQSLADIINTLSCSHAGGVNLGLERINRLLADMGNPETKLPPVIHVAGTNGKGSVIAFLRAMAEAEGLKVHTYTSPHLVSYTERITLAGERISDDYFAKLLKETAELNQGGEVSFFELITATAFLAFSRVPADLVLLETGLGGRLDATNVIARPLASIITSVSRDHMQYLGNTAEEIAAEKICILKPQSFGITAAASDSVNQVFMDYAAKIGSPLLREGHDWQITESPEGFFYNQDFYPRPSLLGKHQFHNAGLAITCAKKVLHLGEDSIKKGIETATWAGRLEHLQKGSLAAMTEGKPWDIWLDGAHNEGAAKALKDFLSAWQDKPLHLICGMLMSKEADVFMQTLAPFASSIHTLSITSDEHHAYSADDLAKIAKDSGAKNVTVSQNVCQAVQDIMAKYPEGGRILICGSLYLLGEILADTTDFLPSAKPLLRAG